VSQIVVSRFLSGQRDIRMETADRLAEVLGLKLASGP
jgi:plasmid maintenance system antidote protein VapI